MFWRRRNKKLDKRLHDVVESTEEVRKSYHPKPRRVIIDTSFVDQQSTTALQEQHINSAPISERAAGDNEQDVIISYEANSAIAQSQQDTFENIKKISATPSSDGLGYKLQLRQSFDDDQTDLLKNKALKLAGQTERNVTSALKDSVENSDILENIIEESGEEAHDVSILDPKLDISGSEDTVLEIEELYKTIEALKQSLKEERIARIEVEARTNDSHAGFLSTSELLSKIKEAVARTQAAEDRELKSREREAEAFKEVLLLREELDKVQQNETVGLIEKDTLKVTIERLKQEIAEKSERLTELETMVERVSQLEQVVSEKTKLENAANQKIATFEKEAATLKGQLSRREEELRQLKPQLDDALYNSQELQLKLNNTEEIIAEADEAHKRQADALQHAEKTKKELHRLEISSQHTSEKLAAEQAARGELEDQLVGKNHKIAELEEQLSAGQSALTKVENEFQIQAKQFNEEYNQKLKSADLEAAKTKAERDAARAKIHALEKQLAVADKNFTETESKLNDMQAEFETLQKSFKTQSSLCEKFAGLEEDLQITQAKLTNITQELAQERSKNEIISAELKSTLANMSALQDKLAHQQHCAEKTQGKNQLEVELASKARSSAETAIGKLKHKLAGLEGEFEREKSAKFDLELELEKVRKEAAKLQDRLSAANEVVQETRNFRLNADQREAELVVRIEDLENENAFIQAQAEKAHLMRPDLEKQIRNLKQQLEKAQKEAYSKAANSAIKSNGADLRFAADKPLFMKATKSVQMVPKEAEGYENSSPKSQQKVVKELVKEVGKGTERKTKKTATNLAGSIQKDTELTVLDCRVFDRSSDSACIDIIPDKFNASIGMPVVGDKLTLTIKTAWDTTTIYCEVTWLEGMRCGLQFKETPKTIVDKSKKSVKKRPSVKKRVI